MKIQPFGERVLIKVLEPEETEGGLLVVPTSKETSNKGEVVAVGEGAVLQDGTIKPLSLKVGDKVLFNPNLGVSITEEKEIYKILGIKDILGRIID